MYGAAAAQSRLFWLEPEPTQFVRSRSRPNLFGAGVGSGTLDIRSRSRPKRWRLRNTGKKPSKYLPCLILFSSYKQKIHFQFNSVLTVFGAYLLFIHKSLVKIFFKKIEEFCFSPRKHRYRAFCIFYLNKTVIKLTVLLGCKVRNAFMLWSSNEVDVKLNKF